MSEDQPDAPAYVRDRTPLRKGQMATLALRDEFRRDPSLPMLLGDDIFIRGIRRGIEQGDYVYQRGHLLFGSRDPPADIRINEQAVVMTMAYAKNKGVWPCPAPKPTPPGPDPPPPVNEFSAEGLLKDAQVQLWEQARTKRVDMIGTLKIRMFDAGDAFRALGTVGAALLGQAVARRVRGTSSMRGGVVDRTERKATEVHHNSARHGGQR